MTQVERLLECLRAAKGPLLHEAIAQHFWTPENMPATWRKGIGAVVSQARKQGFDIRVDGPGSYVLIETPDAVAAFEARELAP